MAISHIARFKVNIFVEKESAGNEPLDLPSQKMSSFQSKFNFVYSHPLESNRMTPVMFPESSLIVYITLMREIKPRNPRRVARCNVMR